MVAMPTESSPGSTPTPARGVWFLLGVMAAAAAMVFLLWRGPWRAVQNTAPPATMSAEQVERLPRGSSDLSLIWMSTRAWMTGESPYTLEGTGKAWAVHSGSPFGPPSERSGALLVYPPSTFVVMAPWCLGDWRTSAGLWAVANTVLLLATVVLALGLAGLGPKRAVWWWAAAGMLVLAPGHTAISVGQVSVLVVFLIVLGQALRERGRQNACGLALGIACAIKPQIALLFLAYEVGRKRWRVGIAGGATLAAILAAGVLWLGHAGVDWMPQWRANLAAFGGSNNANPTAANPLRYHLINLHYLLHGFVDDPGVVKAMVYGVCGGLVAGYFLADRGKPEARGELTSTSFVAAIALLVVYHRMYDAVVLLLPAAWAAREAALGRWGWTRWAAAASLAAFLGPGASVLNSLAASGRLPAGIAEAGWFRGLVMPHAAVALLVLAVGLLIVRARDPRRGATEPG